MCRGWAARAHLSVLGPGHACLVEALLPLDTHLHRMSTIDVTSMWTMWRVECAQKRRPLQGQRRAAHLVNLLHGLHGLVHELPVVLLWPVAPPLQLKGCVLRR